jgi:hypothetical protein
MGIRQGWLGLSVAVTFSTMHLCHAASKSTVFEVYRQSINVTPERGLTIELGVSIWRSPGRGPSRCGLLP